MKKKLLFLIALFVSIQISADFVSSVEFINTKTDQSVMSIPQSGGIIDVSLTPYFNFRVKTNPEPVSGSCMMTLTLPNGEKYIHNEAGAPYALFGDKSGDFLSIDQATWLTIPNIINGDYNLHIIPGTGTAVDYKFTIKGVGSSSSNDDTDISLEYDTLKLKEGDVLIEGEKKQYHRITLTLGGPQTKETDSYNPFLNYRLEATFTKGDKSIKVPGFYDADGRSYNSGKSEGNIWRVHFRPEETGVWNYSISMRKGENIAVSDVATAGEIVASLDGKTGTINVSNSDKTGRDFRGRGRLKYIGGRYLQLSDGEYFIKAGTDSPENLLDYKDFDNTPQSSKQKIYAAHSTHWADENPVWMGNKGKNIIGVVNYMAYKGLNSMSFITMAVNGDDSAVFPFVSKSNLKQYDCSKLGQWNILFEYAQSKGIFLHFKLEECENETLMDGGDTGITRKLYLREMIARFGDFLALNWNLGEESGANFRRKKDKPVMSHEQRIEMSNYMASHDPYKNHIVIHTAPGDQDYVYTPMLGDKSGLTGLSLQCPIEDVHNLTKSWITKSADAGKQWAVANDEQNPADYGIPGDDDICSPSKQEVREKVLYGNLMAGGWGVEYYFGYKLDNSDLTCEDFTSRDQAFTFCHNALVFFNKYVPFWEMESHDELSSNAKYCFAKMGKVYVIYMSNGGNASIDLASGDYTVDFYDPIKGGDLVQGNRDLVGGSTVSVGSTPDNKQDWLILIRKKDFVGNANNDAVISCDSLPKNAILPDSPIPSESYTYDSYTDFSKISGIAGFVSAYKDNGNKCLAVNASQYKDKYAAAQTNFNGQSGKYDIIFTSLTETDGESSYVIKVNGVKVGEFQNPETDIDYTENKKAFTNIQVNKGDLIQVEFNTHTNGKKPEGNTTAYSRGRWKSITFAPAGTTVIGSGAWIEKDGYLVIDVENASDYESKGFEFGSGYAALGRGYLRYKGADHFGSANMDNMIKYAIVINTPGTYQCMLKSCRDLSAATFDAGNDSYIRITASKTYAKKGSQIIDLKDTYTKMWVQKDEFSWDTWGETHASGSKVNSVQIFATFDQAGTYLIEYGGRTSGHMVDRIVLFQEDKKSIATDLNTLESLRTQEGSVIITPPLTPPVTPEEPFTPVSEYGDENLFKNPSFEDTIKLDALVWVKDIGMVDSSQYDPKEWFFVNDKVSGTVSDESTVKNGKFSMEIKNNNPMGQKIILKANTKYYCSFWFKLINADTFSPDLQNVKIKNFASSDSSTIFNLNYVNQENQMDFKEKYKKIEFEFDSQEAGEYQFEISGSGEYEGKWPLFSGCFDEMLLIEKSNLVGLENVNVEKETLKFATINGLLYIKATQDMILPIHNICGCLIKNLKVVKGDNLVLDLLPGVYIVGKNKIIVK